MVWVTSSSRSARVDFPWSMCATMLKLRMRSGGITGPKSSGAPIGMTAAVRRGQPPGVAGGASPVPAVAASSSAGGAAEAAVGPTAVMPFTVAVGAEVRVLVQERAVGGIDIAGAGDVVTVVGELDAARRAGRHRRVDHPRLGRSAVVARGRVGQHHAPPGRDSPDLEGDEPVAAEATDDDRVGGVVAERHVLDQLSSMGRSRRARRDSDRCSNSGWPESPSRAPPAARR